jgi:hypothetical protein
MSNLIADVEVGMTLNLPGLLLQAFILGYYL